MTLHLDGKQLDEVVRILKKNGFVDHVFAFGSRVRGDCNKYSDLDLVVRQHQPIETSRLIQLKQDFEESQLSITVDVVEWLKISDDFKQRISPDLVAILIADS